MAPEGDRLSEWNRYRVPSSSGGGVEGRREGLGVENRNRETQARGFDKKRGVTTQSSRYCNRGGESLVFQKQSMLDKRDLDDQKRMW